MFTSDKIDTALARVKADVKKAQVRKFSAIIAEVKENISLNPFSIGDEIGKLEAVYENASKDKKIFKDEVHRMLAQAIDEHMEILLIDAQEIITADKLK